MSSGPVGAANVPRDLRVDFWAVVLLINIAVFGLAVGPIVWYFRADPRMGGALVAVGIFAMFRGMTRYRRLRAEDD